MPSQFPCTYSNEMGQSTFTMEKETVATIITEIDSLLPRIDQHMEPITRQIQSLLDRLEGKQFRVEEKPQLERVILMIRKSSRELIFDETRVSLTFREMDRAKHLTMYLRTLKKVPQQTMWNKITFPKLSTAPITEVL